MTVLFTYDPEGDVADFSFRVPRGRTLTQELDEFRFVEHDPEDDSVVGVFFLFASRGVDLNDVPRADEIRAIIASARSLPFFHDAARSRSA